MKRIAMAGVIGGVVLFVWSVISWMFIPWHVMDKLPDEQGVRQALLDSGAERGIYMVPGHVRGTEMSDEEKAEAETAFTEAHKEGPVALLVYKSEGSSPLAIMSFIMGVILDVVVAGMAAVLLSMAAPALPSFVSRVLFIVLLGAFTAVGTDLANWNWMHYPLRFTLEMAADRIVASVLLGVVLAILIKPESGMIDESADFEVAAGM